MRRGLLLLLASLFLACAGDDSPTGPRLIACDIGASNACPGELTCQPDVGGCDTAGCAGWCSRAAVTWCGFVGPACDGANQHCLSDPSCPAGPTTECASYCITW